MDPVGAVDVAPVAGLAGIAMVITHIGAQWIQTWMKARRENEPKETNVEATLRHELRALLDEHHERHNDNQREIRDALKQISDRLIEVLVLFRSQR